MPHTGFILCSLAHYICRLICPIRMTNTYSESAPHVPPYPYPAYALRILPSVLHMSRVLPMPRVPHCVSFSVPFPAQRSAFRPMSRVPPVQASRLRSQISAGH